MAGERLGSFDARTGANVLPHERLAAERERLKASGGTYRVAVGADHGGYEAKELVKAYLESLGHRVFDLGTNSPERCDYPDFAAAVARAVAREQCDRGIMIDAAGIGSSMVCNKIHGVRAALCYNAETAANSRAHNNANVLTLGARFHDPAELCEIVRIWLETPFEGGRHWPRINKMMATEHERNL